MFDPPTPVLTDGWRFHNGNWAPNESQLSTAYLRIVIIYRNIAVIIIAIGYVDD